MQLGHGKEQGSVLMEPALICLQGGDHIGKEDRSASYSFHGTSYLALQDSQP
jgi:hypothetical protein